MRAKFKEGGAKEAGAKEAGGADPEDILFVLELLRYPHRIKSACYPL